jgi:hypothetical protein
MRLPGYHTAASYRCGCVASYGWKRGLPYRSALDQVDNAEQHDRADQ